MIPYNEFLGICVQGDGDSSVLFLPDEAKYTNHLGSVHAGALFSLAEACSGHFLLQNVSIDLESVMAVVRSSNIKYRSPAKGRVRARCLCERETLASFEQTLVERGRALLDLPVELLDDGESVVATASFRWFASLASEK